MQFTPIQTDRLTLRPCTASDIPGLVPLIGTHDVAVTTLRIPHPYTEADARDYLKMAEDQLATGRGLHLGVFLRDTGAFCGGIGLTINQDHRRAELGYWIGHPYWGKGYATEAAIALVEYGFQHLGLHRIFAGHFAGNSASANVLKKIGMRHEGTERDHILKWGKFIDIEVYAVLSSDWKETHR